MISGMDTLLIEAKHILRTEGMAQLLGRSLKYTISRLLRYQIYYIYEHILEEKEESDFLPKMQNFSLKIVSSNKDADELMRAIGYDFRRCSANARRRLDKGAIAFCLFVNNEIAYIGWVALNEQAKKSLDQPPYKVNFSNGEACTGGGWAKPEYRGNGCATYTFFKACQFLRGQGKIVARDIAATNNIAPQRMLAKFDTRAYAQGYSLEILWWRYWREKPLPRNWQPSENH